MGTHPKWTCGPSSRLQPTVWEMLFLQKQNSRGTLEKQKATGISRHVCAVICYHVKPNVMLQGESGCSSAKLLGRVKRSKESLQKAGKPLKSLPEALSQTQHNPDLLLDNNTHCPALSLTPGSSLFNTDSFPSENAYLAEGWLDRPWLHGKFKATYFIKLMI